jgi:hypothetical protein
MLPVIELVSENDLMLEALSKTLGGSSERVDEA